LKEPEKSFASPTVEYTTPIMKMTRKTVTLAKDFFRKLLTITLFPGLAEKIQSYHRVWRSKNS